jgi:pimeloyl-ACP methyl ester carboxylesterase
MRRLVVAAAVLLTAAMPSAARAEANLACTGDLASRTPVLLVPGTGENPDFFDWNYIPALQKAGIPFCAITLPAYGTADIQTAGEQVADAIRTMHRRAGRRISIVGHSQGGMVPRWALRFFADTRTMVDDLIGLAASNHGTTGARAVCSQRCNAATWQQRDDSRFIAALNAGQETFAGISYTSVYTRFDEIVTPNQDAATGSTSLRTGDGRRSNVAVQDVCPANTSDHLVLGSSDAVGHALAMDALGHDGPADPARIPAAVCAQPFQPGVDPATFATDAAASYAKVVQQFSSGSPAITAEPPLRCYAGGPCPAGGGDAAAQQRGAAKPRLLVSVAPRRVRTGRRKVVVRVRARVDGRLRRVRGARVWLAGARARTNRRGRAVVRKRFVRSGTRSVRVTRRGYRSARARLRVTR